jgi:dihydroorotate dehydrogenase (fumarate)
MADLRTRYLGLELQSPLVASSSPLTGSLDGLRRLEAAGAGAVVLPSLFEEELAEEAPRPGAGHGDQAGYGAGPAAYHSLVEQAKQHLSIPVIASLNGTTRGGWVRHAARLEQAGADALELNIYYVSSRPGLSGGEVEGNYLDVVREVRRAIRIPLAVKLSPYFSSLANLAGQLVEAGADGLVLFNRFYQPDLDIEAMEVLPALELSSSAELRLSLRWIAILHRRWGVSLAASTGVHTATDVVKVLLAGADVAMMTSALLHHGPDHLRPVELGLRDWMDRHGYEAVDQLRGQLSQRSVPDPAAFERAKFTGERLKVGLGNQGVGVVVGTTDALGDGRGQRSRQPVGDIAELVELAALNDRMVEHVVDRAAQRLGAVEHGQDRPGDGQPAVAQPDQQVGDHGGVLGRALGQGEGNLGAVDGDP